MGDFVGQHAGHLVLALRGQDQARIHADVATERREGIDLAVAQQEEGERLLRPVAGTGQALADIAQPAVQQRIFQDVALVAQLGQHHAAIFGLFRRRQYISGGRTDVGQAVVLGGRRADGQRQAEGEGGRQQAAGASAGAGNRHVGRMLRWRGAGVNGA